ncbi:MAG: hypothetical protein JSU63_19690 [Phycisphaerales bacterium]|nr:MAG: hypothetical protein JSU63_19690 [Phycisphaerales bacterium]
MRLARPTGYLEFVTRHRQHDLEPKTGDDRTGFSETVFEENLALETEGYLYHPGLFDFTLGGLFGLIQHNAENVYGGKRETVSNEGTVQEFNLEGEILKWRRIRGFVRARRDQALEPRAFRTSLETTTTDYGMLWRYVDDKWPTSLQFNYTDVRLDPLGDLEEKHRRTNTDLIFQTDYRFTRKSVLSLDYKRETVDEEPQERDYDSDEVTLKHRWEFGRREGNSLESDLNYRSQRGFLELERLRWRENLRLQHTDRFRTWYKFEAIDRVRSDLSGPESIGERSYSVSASLEHRLYENLVSQVTGFALTQDFDSGVEIDRLGVQATFNYRRSNPWGILLGDYSFHVNTEDRAGANLAAERLDQEHIFNEPNPVILTGPRVDPGSIVIRDESRVTVYREGSDYRVFTIGDRIEIFRVPTGRIIDGQVVLIDYLVEIGGTYTLTTIGQTLSLRQRFDFGLSPYYRLRWQHQRLSPEENSGITPEEISAHLFGLEFRRGLLTLTGEHEIQYSTLTPFDSTRLGLDFNRRFDSGGTGTIRARWVDTRYGSPNKRTSRFFTIEGRYRHAISRNLNFEGAVQYRNEKDSLSGDDDGIDLDLSLDLFVRKTEVRVTYEYGRYNDDFAKSEASALFVQVRRRF